MPSGSKCVADSNPVSLPEDAGSLWAEAHLGKFDVVITKPKLSGKQQNRRAIDRLEWY